MNKTAFQIANLLEDEGWEFAYDANSQMVFTRTFYGVVYTVKISADR